MNVCDFIVCRLGYKWQFSFTSYFQVHIYSLLFYFKYLHDYAHPATNTKRHWSWWQITTTTKITPTFGIKHSYLLWKMLTLIGLPVLWDYYGIGSKNDICWTGGKKRLDEAWCGLRTATTSFHMSRQLLCKFYMYIPSYIHTSVCMYQHIYQLICSVNIQVHTQ